QSPSNPPPLGARASRPLLDRGTPESSALANKAGETPALPAQRGEGDALPSPLAAQPLDRLSGTRERPLFSPTRRPPPPPPPRRASAGRGGRRPRLRLPMWRCSAL